MQRICRKCGSGDIRGLGYTVDEYGSNYEPATIIYRYECRRCGTRFGYAEHEKTRFTFTIIQRAIALDNTV